MLLADGTVEERTAGVAPLKTLIEHRERDYRTMIHAFVARIAQRPHG